MERSSHTTGALRQSCGKIIVVSNRFEDNQGSTILIERERTLIHKFARNRRVGKRRRNNNDDSPPVFDRPDSDRVSQTSTLSHAKSPIASSIPPA